MKKQILLSVKLIAALALITACTKKRNAELPEEQQSSVFAITEFGTVSEDSKYSASITSTTQESLTNNSVQALNLDSQVRLFAHEVNVPSRMKFMFDNLPLTNLQNREFKIVFSVDKEYITSYKIITDTQSLSVLEKSIASTAKELQLMSQAGKVNAGQAKSLSNEQRQAIIEKEAIKSGKQAGALLVPLFKYRISGYGTVVRAKNDLKEETARLELKSSEWKDATHITLEAKTDSRLVIGMGVDQLKQLKQVFSQEKLDNQVMTAQDLQQRLSVGMKFMSPETTVFTRLDTETMLVYEITSIAKLNENQLRLLKNKASNEQILSCQDESVAKYIKSSDKDCVIVLMSEIPIAYKDAKLTQENELGSSSQRIELQDVQKSKSVGLVEIRENAAAKQVDISATSGILDPNSTIKISDIKGEFFYRRTFEAASNMFLGRTGTSGDMTIIRFELEDNRIVVRNQQSLINYTGQGAKDREELMSFPVTYFRMVTTDVQGNKLTIPQPQKTTKEKAEYAMIDWTNNTIPDSNSPLAFYAGGACFAATSSLKVTDTDMRLATDGVLNYSLSGSYTVRPDDSCVAIKDVNSAYWGGSYQFNFNITERISFLKHKDPSHDVQFAGNISSMAQAAFNFGLFTLADKVTGNGTLSNRDGSEKYMPIIHDFRNGKKLRYYLGGINNKEATSPERRKLLIDATKQVIKEWNDTLKISFRGTELQRDGDYLELIVDENSEGHLGDLDRNYIWFNELPAENGLLGVAQPAANPRSGTIKSANVIVYTGNTYNQTEALLKMSKISREYEKDIAEIKKAAIAEAEAAAAKKAAADAVLDASGDNTVVNDAKDVVKGNDRKGTTSQQIQREVLKSKITLNKAIKALQLDHKDIKNALNGMKKTQNSAALRTILTKDIFKRETKGQDVRYLVTKDTFLKKLTDLAVQQKAYQNPNQFELEVNKAFLDFGGLDENVKIALKRRSQLLDAVVRFDNAVKNRAGCFTYSRDDINDEAQIMDPKDEKNNLMLNFRKNVMSTLSHELGHAFGLLHNFKGSTDKANYEFKGETTGRNYSSIMDYIADIDMRYKGPEPYDAHAIRAGYTGMVEANEAKIPALKKVINVTENGLVSMNEVMTKLAKKDSLVHFTRDTINRSDLLKYYAQCDDTDTLSSVMCARFDSGGSATEIVQNLINDYHRAYVNRNYVYDKIVFGGSQKMAIINRNIALFQNIRAYLDEAITSYLYGTGLPADKGRALVMDQFKAAKMGYRFFHELLRIPDSEEPVMALVDEKNPADPKNPNKVLRANPKRFTAVQYTVKDAEGKEKSEFKVIESRSSTDKGMGRDKLNTVGITYDKAFGMLFLLQSSASRMQNESTDTQISYLDLEQALMGIPEPAQSPTMNLLLNILQNKLTAGFFLPISTETPATLTEDEFNKQAEQLSSNEMVALEDMAIEVPLLVGRQTAIGSTIGLAQSKWRNFDAFAEAFKVSKVNGPTPTDRLSVAKLGHDPRLGDARMLFASQNAVGSSVLVDVAARNSYHHYYKMDVFAAGMMAMYKADQAFNNAVIEVITKVCEKGEDSEECKAILAKSAEELIAEHAELAKAKADADKVAQTFIAQLRKLNTSGIILEKSLDAADSPLNLDTQVNFLREVFATQLNTVMKTKQILEAAEGDQVQKAINEEVLPMLTSLKEQNDKLVDVHLFATAFAVVNELVAPIKIALKSGGEIPAQVIVGVMSNTTKLKDDLDIQLPVIDDLATYSNLVDPDTAGR
ncbi:zinc-dependent metalloprotease [bacterium]|nr:zinc-dependent metalloprotease [bacterium]